MRKTHRLDRGGDRTCVDELDILPGAPDGHVRAQRFAIERDRASAQLGADVLAQREEVRGAGADTKPNDARAAGRWEAAGTVQLDVERGDPACRRVDRGGHVREALVRCLAEERQSDVHQLRLHATKRGKVRSAAERRLGDLGWKWERDEEPYPRRLEPCGVSLVSDKQSDEHHPEKAAEARKRGRADALAARDAFPCVGDQSTHCDTRSSKQRAACSSAERVT